VIDQNQRSRLTLSPLDRELDFDLPMPICAWCRRNSSRTAPFTAGPWRRARRNLIRRWRWQERAASWDDAVDRAEDDARL